MAEDKNTGKSGNKIDLSQKNSRFIAKESDLPQKKSSFTANENDLPKKKSPFTAKKLALIAAFTALAFGASFLDFPIFPAAPFLKLDFSFAIMLIAAYMLGALSGEIIIVAFTLFRLPFTQTGMIGEFANFIMAQFFVFLPSLFYGFKRKFSVVAITLCLATLVVSGIALIVNEYLLFPLYGMESLFADVWYMILLFNLIKGASNAVITVSLYKRLKKILHKFL